MSLKEIRMNALKEDNDLFSYPFRYVSTIITSILIKTEITPIQVTIFHIFLGIISAFLFSIGLYTYTIIASALLIFVFILDCVDGEIARYKKNGSELGIWLDHVSDYIILFMIIASITLGTFKANSESITLSLGLISLMITAIIGVISISRMGEKVKKNKAVKLPFKFKFSKRLHLGVFTPAILFLTIGPLTKQINIMFGIYIFIMFFAMIKVFIHRWNFVKKESEQA